MINYDQYIYMDTYGAWCEPLRGEDVAPPWQLKEKKSDQYIGLDNRSVLRK